MVTEGTELTPVAVIQKNDEAVSDGATTQKLAAVFAQVQVQTKGKSKTSNSSSSGKKGSKPIKGAGATVRDQAESTGTRAPLHVDPIMDSAFDPRVHACVCVMCAHVPFRLTAQKP